MKKHKAIYNLRTAMKLLLLAGLIAGSLNFVASAATPKGSGSPNPVKLCNNSAKNSIASCPTASYHCGGGTDIVYMSINIGCKGKGNALTDAVFAIIRFLSIGVGMVITASTVYAGVQYSLARDDPSQVGQAKGRIMNNLSALLIYIFAYAILNYVIPGQFLK